VVAAQQLLTLKLKKLLLLLLPCASR